MVELIVHDVSGITGFEDYEYFLNPKNTRHLNKLLHFPYVLRSDLPNASQVLLLRIADVKT
eukprot:5234-Rhodomonas_salina.2